MLPPTLPSLLLQAVPHALPGFCNVCLRHYVNLKQHYTDIHCAAEAFPCRHCGQVFKQKRSRWRHETQKHGRQEQSGETPVKASEIIAALARVKGQAPGPGDGCGNGKKE